MWLLLVTMLLPAAEGGTPHPQTVRIPLSPAGEVDLADIARRLADRAGLKGTSPGASLKLPIAGLAGALARSSLAEDLGPGVGLATTPGELVITFPADAFSEARLPELRRRILDLSDRTRREALRSLHYGMRALGSYRPNDPSRPTILLLHGINSSSASFTHMIEPLESAGYGLVVYDFPFNRDLDASVAAFRRDWADFRRARHDTTAWAILTHSMGGLLARAYVEGDGYGGDVSDLILIGPPNGGSAIAKAQTVLQLVEGMQAVKGRRTGALAHLSDGLGAAADDLRPGSTFLKALNARPRREGVRYHILVGDVGFLNKAARARADAQYQAVVHTSGLLGGLARLTAPDLPAQLDEMTDGLGDGCVSVASARLAGVDDFEVLHVNHVELIRGPLLFPDPGPVACMPFVLSRLGVKPARPAARP